MTSGQICTCHATCNASQAVVVGFNLGGTNPDYPGYGCLAGHNDATHRDKTLQQCKVACEARLTCKSFDFYVGTHNCMLSDSNFEDVGSTTATTDCRFYEKAIVCFATSVGGPGSPHLLPHTSLLTILWRESSFPNVLGLEASFPKALAREAHFPKASGKQASFLTP